MSGILLTAIITFIISGIGGALFERWMSRAKPAITVTSVGFCYGDDLVQVENKIIELADIAGWGSNIVSNMNCKQLEEELETIKNIIEQLNDAINICEQWLQEHEQGYTKHNENFNISLVELKRHPYIKHAIMNRALTGGIRRGEIAEPPVTLESIRQTDSNYQTIAFLCQANQDGNYIDDFNDDGADDIYLLLGNQIAQFTRCSCPLKYQRNSITLLAESFARGIGNNIAHYTQEFIFHANSDVHKLEQVRSELGKVLLPKSKIVVDISIYNSGRSAIALRPYVGLRILQSKRIFQFFILSTQPPEISYGGEDKDRSIQSNKAPKLFPSKSENPYVNLPPGDLKNLRLITNDNIIEDDILTIKNIYSSGVLTCQVIAMTLDTQEVWSPVSVFGARISDDESRKLEKILRDRPRKLSFINRVFNLQSSA